MFALVGVLLVFLNLLDGFGTRLMSLLWFVVSVFTWVWGLDLGILVLFINVGFWILGVGAGVAC